ncbi:hypothetical protein Golomagni_02096 [Golovinomyces magnicellulatus]|nr:hypothetical protein Golomagni_02096 [Golovinomyces magnicellulatus]
MAVNGTLGFETGRYPIVLSDALLGKSTKELYTGIRYNHKVVDNSYSPSDSHRLKSNKEDPARFNISFSDHPDKLSYHGGRAVDETQFILIFDAAKENFVLHRLDSNFDMTPSKSSGDSSESDDKNSSTTRQKKPPRESNKESMIDGTASRRNSDKPKKREKPVREPTPEEEDSDDGLTIEYPGGQGQIDDNSHTLSYQRQIAESSERDGDVSHDEDEIEDLKLPSPAHNPMVDMSDEDMEMALEAELEQELMKESAAHTVAESESDESEEE